MRQKEHICSEPQGVTEVDGISLLAAMPRHHLEHILGCGLNQDVLRELFKRNVFEKNAKQDGGLWVFQT